MQMKTIWSEKKKQKKCFQKNKIGISESRYGRKEFSAICIMEKEHSFCEQISVILLFSCIAVQIRL